MKFQGQIVDVKYPGEEGVRSDTEFLYLVETKMVSFLTFDQAQEMLNLLTHNQMMSVEIKENDE